MSDYFTSNYKNKDYVINFDRMSHSSSDGKPYPGKFSYFKVGEAAVADKSIISKNNFGTRTIDGGITRADCSSLNQIYPCFVGLYDRCHDVFRVRLLQLGKNALKPQETPFYTKDIDKYMSNKCCGTHYTVGNITINSNGIPFGLTEDETIIAKDMLGLHMSTEDAGVLKHMVRTMQEQIDEYYNLKYFAERWMWSDNGVSDIGWFYGGIRRARLSGWFDLPEPTPYEIHHCGPMPSNI